MHWLKSIVLILGLSLYLIPLPAQDESIRNTRIEAVGDAVYIHYDIKGDPGLKYDIWLEVTDGRGKLLDVRSLSGDVGAPVNGGNDKLIIWKAGEDGINLENQLFFQVNANFINKPGNKAHSRAGLMLQSAVFPGLGLTRYTGNPHWLKGVAAYACVGGAIAFNHMALASYNKYSESTDPADAANLYSATIQQHKLSTGFAFTAALIWIADLGWTYLETSDLKVGAGFDPLTGIPLLRFSLKF